MDFASFGGGWGGGSLSYGVSVLWMIKVIDRLGLPERTIRDVQMKRFDPLNPKPSTLDPKPYTLNPKPQTLNPKPLNP